MQLLNAREQLISKQVRRQELEIARSQKNHPAGAC
jgi:hypothetical protein